eukprot:7386721-Prymnesium_polylepis.1
MRRVSWTHREKARIIRAMRSSITPSPKSSRAGVVVGRAASLGHVVSFADRTELRDARLGSLLAAAR